MGIWKQSGFSEFSEGTLGNGGQNIYVSANGIIQRVYRFDLNSDGYADVLFATSQDMNEAPPVSVYRRPLGDCLLSELPASGGFHAAIGDLNGDGYDDLVVANQHNGVSSDVPAYVYYGSSQGLSGKYKIELPAPNSRAVAIGDFNGDGLMDIAFASHDQLKIFYQTADGFIPSRSVVLDLDISHMIAEDLDGDGYADLYIRGEGQPRVLWGGPDGIQAARFSPVGGKEDRADALPNATPGYTLYLDGWVPKALRIGGAVHLFRNENNRACFYPVAEDRTIGRPLMLDCPFAVSAASGDLNGNGKDDIVLLVCEKRGIGAADAGRGEERSWIYWGGDGYRDERRTALPTVNARDVKIADLNGNGHPDIVVCQGRTDIFYTTESLIYPGTAEGVSLEPVRLPTHDATTVLIGRAGDEPDSQLIFVNRITGRVRGDIPAVAYLGGKDGFSADRKIEFPAQGAVDAICCDFNDDGWHDVLIVNCSENAVDHDQGSFLYFGGAEGFDINNRVSIPTHHAHGCAVGDFRKSGYLDLVVGGIGSPELQIYRGGPNGFDVHNPQIVVMDAELLSLLRQGEPLSDEQRSRFYRTGGENTEIRWLFTADFNRDGWLDLFVSQCYGRYSYILWGGPEGFSLERSTRLATEGAICAQAADLNDNGWLDLIVGGHMSLSKQGKYDSNIYIYWGGPEGYREDRKTMLPAQCVNSLAIADFNNNGILDIFATSYHSGHARDLNAYIYWGQPDGVYSTRHRKRLFTHSSSGCMAADFNEDGYVDLAVANHKTYGNHNGLSYIWWNGPDGFSEDRTTPLPTSGPHGMMSVDPGNIMNRGPEEYYISRPYKLPDETWATRISWAADIPAKTWVKAQIRFASSEEELRRAGWQGDAGPESWLVNGQPFGVALRPAGWIQYRLALGAVNGGNSPRVSEVRVEYGQAG